MLLLTHCVYCIPNMVSADELDSADVLQCCSASALRDVYFHAAAFCEADCMVPGIQGAQCSVLLFALCCSISCQFAHRCCSACWCCMVH